MSAARKSASSDGNGRSSISLLNMENNAGQTEVGKYEAWNDDNTWNRREYRAWSYSKKGA